MMNDTEANLPEPELPRSAVQLGGGVWVARADCRYAFSRSSGPGGQNVNKVNTRAELRITLAQLRGIRPEAVNRLRALAGRRLNADDELVLVADSTRSQLDNRQACLERLRELVSRAIVPPTIRRKTKPTRGSKERRLKEKKISSQRKSNRQVRGDD